MRGKWSIALVAVSVTLAVTVGGLVLDRTMAEPTTDPEEYSVIDGQHPLDQPGGDLADLEEPLIEGPEPTTARDFVDDSRPGPETAPETLTPSGPGVSEEGGGWTAIVPENCIRQLGDTRTSQEGHR